MNRRWIEALIADSGRIEIRHLPSGRSIIVDSADDAIAAAGRQAGTGNLYATLNRPQAGILAGRSQALTDADIETVVFLPFDFDPVRPAGTAATEAELADAIAARDAFVLAQASRGWPAPARSVSGNGAHAIYRVLLRNDDATRQMLRAVYSGLKRRYSDDAVLFDSTVRNPARIWRLYGSTNRKGIQTTDRPHRISTVTMPADWRRVPTREIERLASEFMQRKENRPVQIAACVPIVGAGDFATLDAVRWFAAHGLYVGHIAGNVHEVVCPWEHEHSTAGRRDTIVFEADGGGWPGFFCHHAHCDGRGIREVMNLWGDADTFCARAWRVA